MNLFNENEHSNTEDFIKSLTAPSLSKFTQEIKDYTSSPEMMQNPDMYPVQQPVAQLEMPISPIQSVPQSYEQPIKEKEDSSDHLLMEAHQATKENAAREQILKENYLKAEQRASNSQREIYSRDLQLAQFLLKNAIEDQDSELQAELHTEITSLQNKLTKHDIEYENFVERYQQILNDKPKVINYTPTYDEQETSYQESQARHQFRKQNAWYDFESQGYSPKLVEQATKIEDDLIAEYQLKNLPLESPAYFEDLKGRIFKKYGISQPQGQTQGMMNTYTEQNPDQQNWQTYQQQPQVPNPFMPHQVPQIGNTQNPYPQMPVQPYQMQQMQQQQYGPPTNRVMSQPYGPPTAPVNYGNVPITPVHNSEQEAMYSQKAYQIFEASLNPVMAPQLKNLSPQQKRQLFEAAIKQGGR